MVSVNVPGPVLVNAPEPVKPNGLWSDRRPSQRQHVPGGDVYRPAAAADLNRSIRGECAGRLKACRRWSD